MPSEETKLLKFNQYQKSDKVPAVIYADLECLTQKIDLFKNNPKIHLQQKQVNISNQFFQYRPHMSIISSFKSIEKKHVNIVCKHVNMKKFRESLREHANEIINFKKKNVTLLTNEQQNSYQNSKICYICKEKFENKYVKYKKVS